MEKAAIIEKLREFKQEFSNRYGVTKIGIFGSVARDQDKEGSDIDIVVEMEKPNLFYMVHIKDELEKMLNVPVDIVRYRAAMNRYLKVRIDNEAFYV
ncbi:MAG: nucleotidyltransferase family protein [Desulfobacterales bacterium]|nr:nucleotidyltransferase family protein [Desulfobacterales bacterium]